MARKLGMSPEGGRQLLRLHKSCFPDFWRWNRDVVSNAMVRMEMKTVLGWRMYVHPRFDLKDRNKERTLANFPLQANGSDMLRVSIIKAHEEGVRICAPVHDALLIEAPVEEIQSEVLKTQKAMADASAIILDGFELRTDVDVIKWPDRFEDERGAEMWSKIMRLLPDASV